MERQKQRRGFAAMSLEKRTAISRKGGAAVPNEKRAFSQDRDLASTAGTKGGETTIGAKRRAELAAKDTPA